MIIDVTKLFHPDFRPYTLKSAVAAFLESLEVGEIADVESLIDGAGQEMQLGRLQSLVGTLKGKKEFQTRQVKGEFLATVRRIA